MNRSTLHAILVTILVASVNLSQAQEASQETKAGKKPAPEVVLPPGVTEALLAPPPMPRFMLEKPAKVLTLDEMIRQAREAEKTAQAEQKPAKGEPKEQAPKAAN